MVRSMVVFCSIKQQTEKICIRHVSSHIVSYPQTLTRGIFSTTLEYCVSIRIDDHAFSPLFPSRKRVLQWNGRVTPKTGLLRLAGSAKSRSHQAATPIRYEEIQTVVWNVRKSREPKSSRRSISASFNTRVANGTFLLDLLTRPHKRLMITSPHGLTFDWPGNL